MKKLLILLFVTFIVYGCKENTSEPITNNKIQKFKSHNVKTEGTQYFTFDSMKVSIDKPEKWDIAFGKIDVTVETEPCKFFTISNNPVVYSGSETSIAKLDAKSIDEVTDIPAFENFKIDDTVGKPVIGKNWFDNKYEVKSDVYVIKTCDGNYGILQITSYDVDMETHQITNIHWDFKYNNKNIADFSSIIKNTFKTGNVDSETQYYTFKDGAVNASDSYDIKIEGSVIWLGNKCTVRKLENTNIDDITKVEDEKFKADILPTYVTSGWYDFDDNHILIPKDYVYIVKTINNKYVAFEVVNYYDDKGTSGTFTIEWKYL